MKLHHVTALGLAAMLAACGQGSETGASNTSAEATGNANAPAGSMSGEMGNMATPGSATAAAHGTGTVKEIDKSAGTITLEHGPIPEANWPAMTMAFKADPVLIESVNIGEQVDFDLRLEGGAGEITSITRK